MRPRRRRPCDSAASTPGALSSRRPTVQIWGRGDCRCPPSAHPRLPAGPGTAASRPSPRPAPGESRFRAAPGGERGAAAARSWEREERGLAKGPKEAETLGAPAVPLAKPGWSPLRCPGTSRNVGRLHSPEGTTLARSARDDAPGGRVPRRRRRMKALYDKNAAPAWPGREGATLYETPPSLPRGMHHPGRSAT